MNRNAITAVAFLVLFVGLGAAYLHLSRDVAAEERNAAQAPAFEVSSYTLWRRLLTTAAPAGVLSESAVPGPGSIRVTPGVGGAQAEYWEFIANVPARGAPGYAYMVSTGSDSLPGSIPADVLSEIGIPGHAARTASTAASHGSASRVCRPLSSYGCR